MLDFILILFCVLSFFAMHKIAIKKRDRSIRILGYTISILYILIAIAICINIIYPDWIVSGTITTRE